MAWMAWTLPTALFFAAIGALLTGLVIGGILSPSRPRKGMLPMATTRGDRVFIALLGSAFAHLAWLRLTEASLWGAALISLLFAFIVCRWG